MPAGSIRTELPLPPRTAPDQPGWAFFWAERQYFATIGATPQFK